MVKDAKDALNDLVIILSVLERIFYHKNTWFIGIFKQSKSF